MDEPSALASLTLIACGPIEDSGELDEASTYDAPSVEAVLGAYPDPFNPLSSSCPGITATPVIMMTSNYDKFIVSINDPNPTLHKDTVIYFEEQFNPASGDRLTHPRNRIRKLIGPKADGTGAMGVMGLRGRKFEVYVARRCNDTRTRSTLSPVAIADLSRGGTVASISRATRTPIVMAPGSSMATALKDTSVSGSSYPCYRVGYRVRGSSTWTTGGETTGTSLTLSGLLASTEYEFRVSSSCNGSPYDGVGTEGAHTGAWRFTTLAGSTGPVCGDGMCSRGEIDTCPADCGSTPPPPAPVCGDGFCDALNGESNTSCPYDCPRLCGTNRYCFE